MSIRSKRAQLVVGSATILAILVAVAFISSRTHERIAAVESRSSAEAPALVQASERVDVDLRQPAQESMPSPASPSTLPPDVEPLNPSLLPRVRNDPLTSSFVAEDTDPAWSDFAEAQILGEISRLGGLSLITIDVECRTTLCRVQSVFPTTDVRARQRILGVSATLGLEPRPVLAVSNKSGNVAFLAYFSRSKTPPTQSQP
jgi:hypothetical protein